MGADGVSTKSDIPNLRIQIGNDCERGLDAILEIAKKSDDVALLTQCMNALGSISELNPDWRGKIEKVRP